MSSCTSSPKRKEQQFEEAAKERLDSALIQLAEEQPLLIPKRFLGTTQGSAVRGDAALGDSDRNRTRKGFSGLKD